MPRDRIQGRLLSLYKRELASKEHVRVIDLTQISDGWEMDEEKGKMGNTGPDKSCISAALLGAVGGGIIVALATRAIPKMMSDMMSGMMQNMMSRMGESGCDPAAM